MWIKLKEQNIFTSLWNTQDDFMDILQYSGCDSLYLGKVRDSNNIEPRLSSWRFWKPPVITKNRVLPTDNFQRENTVRFQLCHLRTQAPIFIPETERGIFKMAERHKNILRPSWCFMRVLQSDLFIQKRMSHKFLDL